MKSRAHLWVAIAALGLAQTVQAAVFTDSFDAPHDYLSAGTTGTIWDGLTFNTHGGDATAIAANASITNAGVLTFRSTRGNWENGDNDGLLLFKNVTGNFIATLKIANMNNVQWHDAGLIARAATLDDAGAGEDWVAARYFANGNQNALRSVNDNATVNQAASGLKPWLRLARSGDLFTVSRGDDGTNWAVVGSVTREDLAGLALQVGIWQATFSGNEGIAQFDNFTLTLLEGPTITRQPLPAKTMAGGSASFSVAATGIEPLEYQWRLNGTNLTGKTSATLSLSNVQAADAGKYSVMVTDADGDTLSEETTLTVYESGQFVSDNFETFHDYSAGDVTGTIWDGIHNAANLDAGSDTTGGVLHWRNTGEGWEYPNFFSGPVLYKTVPGNFDVEVQNIDNANVDYSDGGLMVRVPNIADAGDGEDWMTLKYFNAQCCAEGLSVRSCDGTAQSQTGTFPSGSTFLRIERRGTVFKFYGKVNPNDEWTLGLTINRPDMAGLALQVGLQHGTYSGNTSDRQFDNFSLYMPSGPVITGQPASLQAIAGETVSFSVTATGIEPMDYQWQRGGTNIAGATSSTLTLTNVALTDAGSYAVVVTDADGSTTSESAFLTVLASMGVLRDDFNAPHDYAGGNVAGTIWDGVMNAQHLEAGADTTGGVLHWRNQGEGWENDNASGPFLYKLVTGDFDAQVEIAVPDYKPWSDGGLMARVPNVDDAGPGEDYVTGMMFSANNVDTWATQNRIRSTDNGVSTAFWTSGIFGQRFLRLERSGSLFSFYTKATAEEAWVLRETVTRSDMPAVLQVGLQHGTFDSNSGADRQYDNFRLAGPNVVGAVRMVRTDNTHVTLSWEGSGLILQSNANINSPAGWTDVAGGRTSPVTLEIGSGNTFFRLKTP